MGDRTTLEQFDRRVGKWRDQGKSVPVASVKAALGDAARAAREGRQVMVYDPAKEADQHRKQAREARRGGDWRGESFHTAQAASEEARAFRDAEQQRRLARWSKKDGK